MKPFTTLTVIFLALLATLQATRLLLRWEIILNGVQIPLWASAVAMAIAAGLAVMLWRESRR